ncbi:MAG: hypothetical protein JSR46_02630 [Verrucomicrobia bacterium]|nr:hypothetical protein [Verrucomicrobiota bacterium]
MSTTRIPRNPKGKLEQEAHSLKKDVDEKRLAVSDRTTWQTGQGRGVDAQNEFPAQYFPDQQEEDERIQMKMRLLQGRDRPLGDAMLTDQDVAYFMKKEETKQHILFDEWFSRLFDTKDINKRRLAQELYPEYYQKREEEIDRQAAIQKKIAMIKLRGIKDLDDLKFVYALQSGDIVLRKVPLYNLDAPQEDSSARFKKGLFNPARKSKADDGYTGPISLGRNMFTAEGIPDIGALAPVPAGFADAVGAYRPGQLAGDGAGLAGIV